MWVALSKHWQPSGSLIGGGLNDPRAGGRNFPGALYPAVRMRNDLLWRDRSSSHAACPVYAAAQALSVAISAGVANRVSIT